MVEEIVSGHPCFCIGEHVDRAIFHLHIIKRTPAGEIGTVIVTDVAGILMPGELGAFFCRLDHILFVKEIAVFAQGGTGDLGH